jgi:small conductance mechanosensitive channel
MPGVMLAAITTLLIGQASDQTTQGFIYRLLHHFGASDFQSSTVQTIVSAGLKIVLILAIAWLASRLGARVSRRMLRSIANRTRVEALSPRASLRMETIGGLISSLWRGVVWIIAGITILGVLGINLTPIIAGATVIGAALGFGAQSLVRDFLSGFFIIAEDQYGVGDTIAVGDTKGRVEAVNLRVTRLRSADGTVWYLPNGEIRRVGNSTIQWARALVDIAVPYGTDVDRATSVIADEAAAVASDPEWSSKFRGEPEVWGVDSMTFESITIRVVARTALEDKDTLSRVLRGRATARLQHEGIVSLGPGE